LAAAAGIALSLVPIMVTLIVTDGMIRGITERFQELGTGHIQVRPTTSAYDIGITPKDATPLAESVAGVRGAWNEIDGLGIILGLQGKTGVTVRAIDPSFWSDNGSKRYLAVKSGRSTFNTDKDVLLGSALAAKVGAKVGSTLRIMTLHKTANGKTLPKTQLFTVAGIVEAGYHEIDSMWCLLTFNAGEKLLDPALSDSYLVVKITDPWHDVDIVAARLNSALGGLFRAYTWPQIQSAQYRSYQTTRQLLLFIMALIVLVAAVNVSAATAMLVIARERDIAVLKTCGAGPGALTAVFVFASGMTGALGAVLGIGAGLALGVNINALIRGLERFVNIWTERFNAGRFTLLDPDFYLQVIPIVINWQTVALIGVFTVVCSLAASFFPAARAGAMKPVALLRKA
jgi:lipoprotein-releasing system permease protein